jgi:hypothetical protein
VTAVVDILLIFRHLQDAETGDFILTGLMNVDWLAVAVVTAVGAVLTIALALWARAANKPRG